tara:strand:- start:1010 stop:1459 length:450 start_codon:yes stop_codon:yes gene_type:complete
MDYKKMMGYGDKKKVTKKASKPKKNMVLEGIQKEMKRWSKEFGGNGLTEFEKKGGKDNIQLGRIYTDKDLPPFKTEGKINETIPAFARQWKNMEKAEKVYQKAVMDLSKAVSKVDKEHGKTIKGLWSYVGSPMKKFRELLSKEVLDKLQ